MGPAGERRRLRRELLSLAARATGMRQDARVEGDQAFARTARLIAAVAVLVVAGIFVSTYAVHDFVVAVGSDTAQAVWRSNVVSELGLEGLPDPGPNVLDAGVDRPGLPLLLAILHGLFDVSPAASAFGLPAAAAAALALAAGAFATGVLGRPLWSFGLVAVLAGASVNVDLFAAGYFDSLVASVVLLGAFVLLLAPDAGARTDVGGAALLAAGALFHWPFAAFAAGLLLATAAWIVVASTPRDRSPGIRIAIGVAAGAVAGWVLLTLAPGRLLSPQLPDRGELLVKLSRLYPGPAIPVVVTLAVGGLVALRGVRETPLAGRRLLTLWALTAGGGVVLIEAGMEVPAHRLVALAIAVPILAGVALATVLAAAGSSRRVWLAVGAGVLAAAVVVGGAGLTASSWLERRASVDAGHLSALEVVVATVETAPPGRPVVVVVDSPRQPVHGVTPAIRRIRALMDPARVADVHIFLGRPEDALAGRRTERPEDPEFTRDSDLVWPAVAPVLDDDPVVIVSGLFYKGIAEVVAAHPEASRAHGLVAFGVPIGQPQPEVEPHGFGEAVRTALLLFATVFVAGLGWSWWLLAPRPLLRTGMAPALGLGALGLAGFVADRLGLKVGSAGAAWGVLAAATAVGWMLVLLRARGIRARGSGR
jgi:hypothetical protein